MDYGRRGSIFSPERQLEGVEKESYGSRERERKNKALCSISLPPTLQTPLILPLR
jgi:hypothetical protein